MTVMEEMGPFLDVPLEVEVLLDQREMPLGEILELESGSIVKLTRSAGENLDVLVGGTLIGVGEIVVSETCIGIRLTDFKKEA